MTNKNRNILFTIPVLLLAVHACSSFPPQAQIPQTESDVPRISAEDTKAAFDSGEAIIVDVRSAESYAAGHAAGAISIPLTEIEANPAGLGLDKEQWIITYCT